jgi:hypothetical protein
LPGRCIATSAGGLLNRHFTLALAGGIFLWPDLAGSPKGSPPRVLPGSALYGVRTFLETVTSLAAIWSTWQSHNNFILFPRQRMKYSTKLLIQLPFISSIIWETNTESLKILFAGFCF